MRKKLKLSVKLGNIAAKSREYSTEIENLMRNFIPQFLALLLVVLSSSLFAQSNRIKGRVIDKATQKPLAFVTLVDVDNKVGTVSDIDGNFDLKSIASIRAVRVSYVGYETDTLLISSQRSVEIELKKKSIELNTFTVYPGENPAHRLIKLAVENRDRNNPDQYNSYQYNSYNKLIATFVPIEKEVLTRADSAQNRVAEKQHLFVLESSTEKSYLAPNQSKEVVLGTQVSGFQNPAFSFVATDLQPFGFYETYVELFDKEYLNPISKGSWNRYLFELKDTLLYNKDSTFIIQYQPKKNSNFEGLKGLLYINSDGYAIENVIAENYYEGLNSFKIQQKYHRINGKWFPQQLNFDLLFNKQSLLFYGRSYIQNVNLSPVLSRSDFDNVLVEIPEESGQRSDFYWDTTRIAPLDQKELETYHFLDSVSKEIPLDKLVDISESMAEGYIPLGYVNLDVNHLLQYNQFEGLRLGIGAHTSDQLLKFMAVGGYFAYGFGDKKEKYGGFLRFSPYEKAEMEVELAYSFDAYTPGESNFHLDHIQRNSDSWRNLLANWMNYNEKYEFNWSFKALRYANFNFYAKHENWQLNNNYKFRFASESNVDVFANTFTNAEVGVRLKYAYKEKVIKTSRSTFSLGTDAPIFWFNFGKGIQDIEGSQLDYNRFEAKLYKAFKSRILGEFSLSLSAGSVSASLPAPYLFVGNGTFEDDIRIVVNNSFQTMRLFEFANEEYAALHYRHRLWRWYSKTPIFRPEFIMSHSAGVGTVSEKGLKNHKGYEFSSMEDGYLESGLIINHLLRLEYVDVAYVGLGIGAFYRYGSYQYADWEDNLALKLSLTFEL